jgi:putative toxin-antitoxin system antitoxin component (TIGR02293 family)
MYGQSIGLKKRELSEIIASIKEGLPATALDRLSREIGVPENKLATTVNIAQRTLTRRKKEGRFNTAESERVLRIARLYERALEVLGDVKATQAWFTSPVKGLGYKTPLDFADTEPGAKEVEDLLGRIEDGVVY